MKPPIKKRKSKLFGQIWLGSYAPNFICLKIKGFYIMLVLLKPQNTEFIKFKEKTKWLKKSPKNLGPPYTLVYSITIFSLTIFWRKCWRRIVKTIKILLIIKRVGQKVTTIILWKKKNLTCAILDSYLGLTWGFTPRSTYRDIKTQKVICTKKRSNLSSSHLNTQIHQENRTSAITLFELLNFIITRKYNVPFHYTYGKPHI